MTQSQSQTTPSLPTSLQSDVVFDASFLDFLIDFRLKSEPQSELYNFHARFYDPELGRFISYDAAPPSLEQPLSLNRYSYVYNNPLKFVDPDGNHPVLYDFMKTVTQTLSSPIDLSYDAEGYSIGPVTAFSGSASFGMDLAIGNVNADINGSLVRLNLSFQQGTSELGVSNAFEASLLKVNAGISMENYTQFDIKGMGTVARFENTLGISYKGFQYNFGFQGGYLGAGSRYNAGTKSFGYAGYKGVFGGGFNFNVSDSSLPNQVPLRPTEL